MLVAAVAGIDHRDIGCHRSYKRSTFFRVTHSTDICIAGNNANSIGNTLALGSGAGISGRKTKSLSSKIHHGCLET